MYLLADRETNVGARVTCHPSGSCCSKRRMVPASWGKPPSRPDEDLELSFLPQDRVVLPQNLLEGRHEARITLDRYHRRESDLGNHAGQRRIAERHLVDGGTEWLVYHASQHTSH